MKRIALIAATSAAALAASLAIAQPQPIPQAGSEPGGTRQDRTERQDRSERQDRTDRQDRSESREQRRAEWREQRAERMQERLEERLSRLRNDMNLKPEQVPLFDAVETVVKKQPEERRKSRAAWREQREMFRDADIMEKLDMRAQRQGERAARSKELADAVRPLWLSLSDEQKTVVRRTVREAMTERRERMERMRDRMEERRERMERMHDRMEERRWRDRRDDDQDRGPRRWYDERWDRRD